MSQNRSERAELPALVLAAQSCFMLVLAEELVALGTSAVHLADRLEKLAEELVTVTGLPEAGGSLGFIAQSLRAKVGVMSSISGRPN